MSRTDAEIEADAEATIKVLATWPRVVKLQHPIERGSERITELTFRRGRMGDMKGMKLGETVAASDLVQIASRMCGQPVDIIEKLDVDDAGEVMDIALDFFAKCLTTGKTRSR